MSVVGATASAVPSLRYALPGRCRRRTAATRGGVAAGGVGVTGDCESNNWGGNRSSTAPSTAPTMLPNGKKTLTRATRRNGFRGRRTTTIASAATTKAKLRGVRDKDGLSSGHRGAALEKWMISHEGFDGCGVKVRWLGPDKGYGGVATTQNIQEGDVIVRVPRSAMLTAEEARFCRNVGRAARKLTEWQALALKLMFERDRYLDESSLGGSVWDEWIDMLPDIDIMREMHPLMWPAEKRRALLKGSPTLARLDAMVDQCAEDRQTILRALGVDVNSSGPASATAWPSQDEVLWAGAIIYSRSFQLCSKFEPMTSFDAERDAAEKTDAVKEVEKIGEQSMVQRGALWWSVEENLQEDEYGSSYDEDDEEGAWGDYDSEDEDEDWRDEDLRVFLSSDDSPGSSGGRARGDSDYFYASSSIDDSYDAATDPDAFFEEDGVFLALVPWADALNHDVYAGSKAVLTYSAATGLAELRASSPFPLGAEVFTSYEPGISRQDLFVNYGFVAAAAKPTDDGNASAVTYAPAAAASGVEEQVEDEDDVYGEGDVVDLPGDEFWEDAEKMLCGASGAAGDRDRQSFAALRSYLTAVGMGPTETSLRVTAGGVSKKAMEWCQLAVTSRSELIDAGWQPPEPGASPAEAPPPPHAIEAWIVVGKLQADEEETGVGLEGDCSAAQARAERARRVMTALCARRLAGYPSTAELAAMSGASGGDDDESTPAFGAAGVARLLRSEMRALQGTLALMDTYVNVTRALSCDLR